MENETTYKKDTAREKIVLFAIGVLLGAVIATVAFFISVKILGVSTGSSATSQQMQGGTPPEMPSGKNDSNNQGGTPPEMPNDENGSNSQSNTPPEKPDSNN